MTAGWQAAFVEREERYIGWRVVLRHGGKAVAIVTYNALFHEIFVYAPGVGYLRSSPSPGHGSPEKALEWALAQCPAVDALGGEALWN